MPRVMLLVLKTNDLLRGIEYRLGTHNRKDSFIEMARCCIRAVHEERMKSTDRLFDKCLLFVTMYWALMKVAVYQRYLTGADVYYRMIGN